MIANRGLVHALIERVRIYENSGAEPRALVPSDDRAHILTDCRWESQPGERNLESASPVNRVANVNGRTTLPA